MARRGSAHQDSLELLLDTICNTFGGVLFIAIMVVLLLQQAGDETVSANANVTPVSPVEIQMMIERLQTASDELARLKLSRDSQDMVLQSFAPEPIQDLLRQSRDLRIQKQNLQAEVDQSFVSKSQIAANITSIHLDNKTVRTSLDEAQQRLKVSQTELEELRKSRIQQIRLPVIRSSQKFREVGFILRYERLYVWHKYSADGAIRLGLNTDEFVVTAEEFGRLVTHPKPLAGIVLDGSERSRDAIRRVFQRFDPDHCHLTMVVRPDSYHCFKHVRDVAIELGFEYRLMPCLLDDPLFDRGSSDQAVQ